jgi:two-component system cell cycle response regulator DivK
MLRHPEHCISYHMALILIVEDNPANMKLAVLVLSSAGHHALQATTAQEGIASAMKEKPDIVLMDMQLPDMDGIEATRILKAAPETAHIPVIAVTASAMKGDKERVLEVCDRYVEKPIDYKRLIAEVADISASSR